MLNIFILKTRYSIACEIIKNYWMRLSRISELFRPRSILSAEAKLRQIMLTEVWIILISCVSRIKSFFHYHYYSCILYYSFVIQNEQKQQKPLSKQNNFTKFPVLFQFMQNTAAKTRGHLQIRELFVMFMSAPRYGKLSVGFQPMRIR
jgi:hypothetical protein